VFAISARGVRDANWDGLQGANRSHGRSHGEDLQRREKRPSPRPHARAEIVNTFLRPTTDSHGVYRLFYQVQWAVIIHPPATASIFCMRRHLRISRTFTALGALGESLP